MTERESGFSYVPIDPCQGVIAALRTARGERIARAFIDLETPRFEPVTGTFPDPTRSRESARAIRGRSLGRRSTPAPGQNTERIAWMAARLRELEARHRSILLGLLDPRLALDPRRLPAPTRTARARVVLLSDRDLSRGSPDLDLHARRAAVYHRPV